MQGFGNEMAKGMASLVMAVILTVCISVPLAIWKLCDIASWVINHVEIK